MRIVIVTPAPAGSRAGNRVTATRWARHLRALGHRVDVRVEGAGPRRDLMIAIHARKSAAEAAAFKTRQPDRPLVVALSGTDLYVDLPTSPEAKRSLELADALIALHPMALERLDPALHAKVHVVPQSLAPPEERLAPRTRSFDVCVVGHMRGVKDPMRTAIAARQLPATSRLRVLHAGKALERRFARQARAEMDRNPRYRWLGDLPPWRAKRLIRQSRLLSLTSLEEGGANVLSEAIVLGTPVVSSRHHGAVGMLGADYPGFFDVGDTRALRRLLSQAERDPAFLETLAAHGRRLAPNYTPARERAALAALIAACETSSA